MQNEAGTLCFGGVRVSCGPCCQPWKPPLRTPWKVPTIPDPALSRLLGAPHPDPHKLRGCARRIFANAIFFLHQTAEIFQHSIVEDMLGHTFTNRDVPELGAPPHVDLQAFSISPFESCLGGCLCLSVWTGIAGVCGVDLRWAGKCLSTHVHCNVINIGGDDTQLQAISPMRQLNNGGMS